MREMLREVQRGKGFRTAVPEVWRPRVNLYETQECFFVCVELAGMPRERIDVHAEPGLLVVRGHREKPSQVECPVGRGETSDVGVHLMEIDSGDFERRVSLPTSVAVEHIDATYKDGYLWITLPRKGS
jgi:HSP20 family molecular chaperone IbpA